MRTIFRIWNIYVAGLFILLIFGCSSNKSTNSGSPAAPSNLIGEAMSPSSTRLSWIDNSNNENGFVIFRSMSQSEGYSGIDTAAANIIFFTDNNLYDSTTYFYYVVAINNAGSSGPSNTLSITTRHSSSAPLAPSLPIPPDSAVGESSTVQLTWHAADPDGDSLRYDLYLGTAQPLPLVASNLTETRYSASPLLGNTTYLWQVAARDQSGNSTSGPVWRFTTAAVIGQAPGIPFGPTPPDSATGQNVNITLIWQCIDSDGDSIFYDIYFGNNSNPPLVASGQISRSYDPGILTHGTTYYWKIVAHDSSGNLTMGPLWMFSTSNANQPPVVPFSPSPPDGAVRQNTNLTLSWQCSDPEGDSLTYDIYLGTTADPPLLISNHVPNSYSPSSLRDSTTYYWKILAHDNQGNETTGPTWNFSTLNSLNQPPNAPSNPQPQNGEQNIDVSTQISWQDSDPDGDTLNFDVYFGTTNPPPFVLNQSGTIYDPPGNLINGTIYYWQIVAHDQHGAQNQGPLWSFATIAGNHPPNAPANPFPPSGVDSVAVNVVLSWFGSDPDNDQLNYDVYFGTANPPPFIQNQAALTYDPPGDLNAGTTYYWRIIAHDDHGNQTSGPVWSFTTVATNQPPNTPSNPSPPNGAINQDINSQLAWLGSDPNGDPLTYDVYFGVNSNPPLVSSGQIPTNYNPGLLINYTTYYWTIIAHDNHGNQTSGPIWSFTTIALNHPPNSPSNPNPLNGQDSVAINTSLSWQASDPDGDSLNFDIYFGTSNPPPFIGNQTSRIYVPIGNLQNESTYYWRIVARDSHNVETSGPVWSFITIPLETPPVEPFNPSPPNNQDSIPLNVQLSWQSGDPDGDPLNYDVYFGTSIPPTFIQNQTETTYSPVGLVNGTIYYWQIIVHDNHGNETPGPIWIFTTIPENHPPDVPSDPHPTNGQNNVNQNTHLTWSDSDPDGDTLNYDIYFGTDNPPPFVANQLSRNYNPSGNLDNNRTYYWLIIAHDNYGHQTSGPIWNFTTRN